MPALDSTTTAVFTAMGISASYIYGVFTSLIATTIDFGLWMIVTFWPFLLGLAFIYGLWRIVHGFRGIGR